MDLLFIVQSPVNEKDKSNLKTADPVIEEVVHELLALVKIL